eukprot:Hpha_TRINITY_DN15129_c0_g2::TRINITY_DN15129_c0_g2_i1::g.128713::m.128713
MRKFLGGGGQGGEWVSDASATQCQICGASFTVTRRRHHCRLCGGVFCNTCSQGRMELPGYSGPQRVCTGCVEAPPTLNLTLFIVDPPAGGESIAWRRSQNMSDKVPERLLQYVRRGAHVRGEEMGDFVKCANGLFLPRAYLSLEPASPPTTHGSPPRKPATQSSASPLARMGRLFSDTPDDAPPSPGSPSSKGSGASSGGAAPAAPPPPEMDEEEKLAREMRKQAAVDRHEQIMADKRQEDAVLARLAPVFRDAQRRRMIQLTLASPDVPRELVLRRVDLKIAACTWCTFGKKPEKAGTLRRWLQIGREAGVVAVGLQEVQSSLAERWIDYINSHLLPANFRTVAAHHMGELVLCIYASEELHDRVTSVELQRNKPGAMFSGGHGTLGVRMTLLSKRFLFVTSHLPPAGDTAEKRNDQYLTALKTLDDLGPPAHSGDDPVVNLVEFGCSGEPAPKVKGAKAVLGSIKGSVLARHDYCIWFGDVNYRLEGEYDEVIEAISHRRFDFLINERDQLFKARADQSAFASFREGEVRFPPTYKYMPKQDTYDTSKKGGSRRVPCYPDRVLYAMGAGGSRADDWLSLKSNRTIVLKYKSYREGNRRSDHRPVACLMACACYTPDPAVLERVADLSVSGMRPGEVAARLQDEFPGANDEAVRARLFADIEPPREDERGPGTHYSSEDDEETLAQVRQRRIELRLERIEALLSGGPLAGDEAAERMAEAGLADQFTEVEGRVSRLRVGLLERRDDAEQQLGQLAMLGEATTNLFERLDIAEAVLEESERASGRREAVELLFASAEQTRTQFEAFEKMLLQCAENDATPPASCSDSGQLRAGYISGVVAGRLKGCHSCQAALKRQRLMREHAAALRTREEEVESQALAHFQAVQERQRQLDARSSRADAEARALSLLHQALEERGAMLSSVSGKELRALELAKRESQLAEQEGRLLRLLQSVSEEQLQIRRGSAMQEAHHAEAARALRSRQRAVELEELDLATLHQARTRFERMCADRSQDPPRPERTRARSAETRRPTTSSPPPAAEPRRRPLPGGGGGNLEWPPPAEPVPRPALASPRSVRLEAPPRAVPRAHVSPPRRRPLPGGGGGNLEWPPSAEPPLRPSTLEPPRSQRAAITPPRYRGSGGLISPTAGRGLLPTPEARPAGGDGGRRHVLRSPPRQRSSSGLGHIPREKEDSPERSFLHTLFF